MKDTFKKLLKPTIKQDELDSFELTHRFAGNGYYFVRHLGDDMCQVCTVSPSGNVASVFLCATALLNPYLVYERPPTQQEPKPPMIKKVIPMEIKTAVAQLRVVLEEGRSKIFNQRVVAA